jgi:hypothetical protein
MATNDKREKTHDIAKKIRASFVKKKDPEKQHILSIRISQKMWGRLQARSRKDGARSVSSWILVALNALLDTEA